MSSSRWGIGIGVHGQNLNDEPEWMMVVQIVNCCFPNRSEESFSGAYDFLESDWGGALWDKHYDLFKNLVNGVPIPEGAPGLKSFKKELHRCFNAWKRGNVYRGPKVEC